MQCCFRNCSAAATETVNDSETPRLCTLHREFLTETRFIYKSPKTSKSAAIDLRLLTSFLFEELSDCGHDYYIKYLIKNHPTYPFKPVHCLFCKTIHFWILGDNFLEGCIFAPKKQVAEEGWPELDMECAAGPTWDD